MLSGMNKFFRIIPILVAFSIIIGSVFAYFLYLDATDFKEKWVSEQKVFLLNDNNRFLAGFTIRDMASEEDIRFLSQKELESYPADSVSTLGDSWKLIIISMSAFHDVNEISFSSETKITKQDIKDILYSK